MKQKMKKFPCQKRLKMITVSLLKERGLIEILASLEKVY